MLRPTLLYVVAGPKIIQNPTGDVMDCRVASKSNEKDSIVYGIDDFQISIKYLGEQIEDFFKASKKAMTIIKYCFLLSLCYNFL